MTQIRLLIFIFIMLFASSHSAQNIDSIYIWNPEVDQIVDAKISPNQDRNVTRLEEVTHPMMVVYHPDLEKKNDIAIIICPGGGYNILAIDLEGYEVAQWFANQGYTAFVLQYSVPKKEKEALQDAQRALSWVRANASKFKIAENKIGIMGFSAGGSLGARLSTQFETKSYDPIDEIDQSSSQPNFAALIYPAYLDRGENNTLTPELTISSSTPPSFIFATFDDPYANSSLVYGQALMQNNVPAELHILPKGGHGYGLRPVDRAPQIWPKLLLEWLNNLEFEKF